MSDPVFPGFEILGKVGEGGMGAVFKAREERLNRIVAIKTLREWRDIPPVERVRLLREARAAAHLSHPGIVQVFALDDAHEPPFFVMEYVEGQTLREQRGALPPVDVAALLEKVARAVAYAHSRGVIHLDLKPNNVVVGPDGEPKVLDFGIARLLDGQQTRLTQTDELVGTPAYMAPERFEHDAQVGPAADVYALGAILYEQLTGRPPFAGASIAEVIAAILGDDPALPRTVAPGIPEPLQRICMKALEKIPMKRYASAIDLAEELRRYLSGEQVLARPTTYDSQLASKAQHHLDDVARWHDDRLIDRRERDRIERAYRAVLTDEPEWLGELRRIRAAQVTLTLGGLLVLLGCGAWMIYHWPGLSAAERIAGSAGPCALLYAAGRYLGLRGRTGPAISFLLVAGLLFAPSVVVALSQLGWFHWPQGDAEVIPEYFSNSQMFCACTAGLGFALMLLRHFRASAFSYLIALMAVATYLTGWFLLDLQGLVEEECFAAVGARLLPLTLILFASGSGSERWARPRLSRPFYALCGASLIAALCLMAWWAPAEWFERSGGGEERLQKILYLSTSGVYLALGFAGDRWGTGTMRFFAFFLFLVTPPSLLIPLHLLEDEGPMLFGEFRLTEVLLPVAATCVAVASIPLQLRTFLYSGFLYLAISLQRITERHFPDERAWALSLMAGGMAMMLLTLLAERLRRRYLEQHTTSATIG